MGAAGPSPSFAGGPPGPVMDRDEVDRALARLGAEHEAIETSLLALQDHAGRRLLEGAELTGVTKDRWASTEQAITLLWGYFDAYTAALNDTRELRARRRWPSREDLVELTDRLRGRSVTVAGTAAHPAPSITGPAKLSEQFTLEELVARMNELYASSLDMVVTADSVWSALPARIDLLSAELQRTRSLAHSVGVRPGEHPAGDELEAITHELSTLRAAGDLRPARLLAAGARQFGARRRPPRHRPLRPGGARPGGHPPGDRGGAAGPAGLRGAADAAARRALARRPYAGRGAVRARRGAGEDRRLRGARGQRPADRAAGAARDRRRVPQALPVAPALAAAGVPGARGGGRTAARPRVVDGGHRAARGPRRAARPAGRVQGEGGPARHGGGPAADRAVRRGPPDAVERAVRSARRRAGGAALSAGGRRSAGPAAAGTGRAQ